MVMAMGLVIPTHAEPPARLGNFTEAYALYDRAMQVMRQVPGGALEQAITCLNRADAVTAETGAEEAQAQVSALVEQAYDLLKTADAPQ